MDCTEPQIRALACQNKIGGWKVAAIDYLIKELEKLGIVVCRNSEKG